MNKKLIALALAASLTGGTALAQLIPPRTLTKKRIVIQNIHRCKEERSTLVGKGDWMPKKQKYPRYVCRER